MLFLVSTSKLFPQFFFCFFFVLFLLEVHAKSKAPTNFKFVREYTIRKQESRQSICYNNLSRTIQLICNPISRLVDWLLIMNNIGNPAYAVVQSTVSSSYSNHTLLFLCSIPLTMCIQLRLLQLSCTFLFLLSQHQPFKTKYKRPDVSTTLQQSS